MDGYLIAALTGILAAVIAAVATRVQLLPEVIDLSFIPTIVLLLALILGVDSA